MSQHRPPIFNDPNVAAEVLQEEDDELRAVAEEEAEAQTVDFDVDVDSDSDKK